MKVSTSLFEIAEEYRDIERHIIESGGEVTTEVEEAMAMNEQDLHDKADAYAWIIRESEGRVAALDAEIARLNARKKVETNLVQRLKGRLAGAVEEFGKFQTQTHNYSLRSSTSVMIEDQQKLPDIFLVEKVSVSPDKKAIKDAINDGQAVPGASLSVKQSIQIR